MMVNNATNINKVKNHLQLNTKKTATYGIGNPDHGLDLTKMGSTELGGHTNPNPNP